MARYHDKKYLIKYDLDVDLFQKLNLDIIDIIPLRKVYILDTTEGKKILKRMEYGKEKIEFIDWCTKKLYEKSEQVMTFNKVSKDDIYLEWNGEKYVLMDLLKGRELTFSNPIEYRKAVNLLANIHLYGNQIIKDEDREYIMKKLDKGLIEKFKEYIDDVEDIYRWVIKYRYLNEFDKIFIENVDLYLEEMKESLELLNKSNYTNIRNNYENLVICHNDLAEHNFLIDDNEEISIIDFDYASIDLKIQDLADILCKGIKNVAFEFKKGLDIINEYNAINNISDEEFKILYSILLFPRDFYSVIKNYYHKDKDWEEIVFLNRLKNKVINDKNRREFLYEYKLKYNIK